MMKIENSTLRGVEVFHLHGRLVASSENLFWETISSKVVDNGARRILLDFQDLTTCDSYGIGELLRIHTSMENIGGRLIIFGVNDLITKVFGITKIDTVLHIVANEKDALEAFEKPVLVSPRA